MTISSGGAGDDRTAKINPPKLQRLLGAIDIALRAFVVMHHEVTFDIKNANGRHGLIMQLEAFDDRFFLSH